ncbi:MAG TPA: phytanoyl-CoA dioxygenase family protein [Caulobacteraceae bacterium]
MTGERASGGVSSALRWLLLPFWLAQVFSGEKSFWPNPLLGDPRLNRHGFAVWRARLAHRLTARRRRRLERLIPASDRLAFERDGYVVKRGLLPRETFAQLVAEIGQLSATAGEFKEGDAITRRIPLTPELLRRLPACRRLLAHPAFRGLTRYVGGFDADPLVFIQTIFTQVDDGPTDPQTSMHIDTFHPTMKAWLLLEDVAEEDGPFTYVPGSHRRTPRREVWERRLSIRASDPKTRKTGGAFRIGKPEMARLRSAKPKRFAAAANTLIVADTYGFHARRRSSRPSMRLEIWAYSRGNPFAPWTRFDLSPARLWQGYAAAIGFGLMELRRKLGMPVADFRQVARATPGAPPEPWEPARR